MSVIGVIIDEMFEDSEYKQPAEAFEEAGHALIHLGMNEGSTVRGKRKEVTVMIDKAVSDASVNDFDAVLIPGGFSPDHLRGYSSAVDFVRDFCKSGKPMFVICHGAQLLITANVLEGRKITGWKSIRQDIKNAGAEYLDQEVVIDRNLISSRGPQDLKAFIDASLERLSEVKVKK